MRSGGAERIKYAILANDQHERSSVMAICESCKDESSGANQNVFSTHCWANAWQKEGEPNGEPSKEMPEWVIGISEGNESETESVTENRWDLDRFMKRPREGPPDSIMWTALTKSLMEPHRTPSSKYHEFNSKPGTFSLISWMRGWSVMANPSGPRGSPCWTPQQLYITGQKSLVYTLGYYL